MARELAKEVDYELVLVSPHLKGDPNGKTDIFVKLTDKTNGSIFYIPQG